MIVSKKLWTIAVFEFKRTAVNKAFLITTAIGPFLLIALMVGPGLLGAGDAAKIPMDTQVGYSLENQLIEANLNQAFEAIPELTGSSYADDVSLHQALLEGTIHYALSERDGAYTLMLTKHRSMVVPSLLERLIRESTLVVSLAVAGLPSSEIAQVLEKPELRTVRIDDEGQELMESDDDQLINFFIVISFMMLIYITTLLYGQMIGRSVVQEKQSKTVELMLSSVNPGELMAGKILGIGLAGILQYSIWICMNFLFVHFLGPILELSIPESLTFTNLLFLFLFFVLAYFLYASGYAAVGAASEDEQQLGQASMIFIFFLMIPLLLSSTLSMGEDGSLGRFLSFFPMTAPIVMLTRIIVHEPAAWEIILSIAIILVFTALMTLLSGRIFRVGILMSGKKPRLRELIRWMREG